MAPPFVALLAGGRGTRFWPLSRRLRPKQLLDVTGEGPLLRVTWDRVRALTTPERLLLVTGEDIASESARLLGLPAANVLAEPVGRNTAPAVALAVAAAAARDPDAVVLCLPSDHHVGRPARLRSLLKRAASVARRDQVPVLLGLPPAYASSDFGWIVAAPGQGARAVRRFVEKPAPAEARKLLAAGALWNSGMFVLPARATLQAMRRLVPKLAAVVDDLPLRRGGRALRAALAAAWPSLPSMSFDAEVLQRWDEVHVLETGELEWSDLGSWEAAAGLLRPDASGNRTKGPAFLHRSSECVVVQDGSSRSIVVLSGERLLVVDAGDVVFVAPRDRMDELRDLVAELDRERPELT